MSWVPMFAMAALLVLGLILLTLVLLLPGGVVGFVNEKARQTLGKLRCIRKWSFSKSATS